MMHIALQLVDTFYCTYKETQTGYDVQPNKNFLHPWNAIEIQSKYETLVTYCSLQMAKVDTS